MPDYPNSSQARHLLIQTRSLMEDVMSEPGATEGHQQCYRRLVARILGTVTMGGHVGRIRSDNEAIFAALDPSFIRTVGQSDVNEPRDEEDEP